VPHPAFLMAGKPTDLFRLPVNLLSRLKNWCPLSGFPAGFSGICGDCHRISGIFTKKNREV
jgi:hypothetical protein